MAKPPLDSRRRLGGELRRLRLAARLSGPELARALSVGQATVSRMETGQVRPTVDTVRRWLHVTKAPARSRDRLIRLAEDAQVDVTGWRSVFRGGMAPQQRAMHQFDATATGLRHFQPFLIPGFFQPAAFARAAILGFRQTDSVHDIDDAVAARLERGRLLLERTETPYHLIVTELGLHTLPAGVTHQLLGGAWALMLEAAGLPHITIQLIPADAPMAQVPVCGWMMYDQPKGSVDPVIVQVETPAALLTFSGPDVPPFEVAWQRMEESALDPAESTVLLKRLVTRKTRSSH